MTPLDGQFEAGLAHESLPGTEPLETFDLLARVEEYRNSDTPPGEHPGEILVPPGFYERNRQELQALGGAVLTLFGAATAVHVSHPNSSELDTRESSRPPIEAPSPGYMDRAPQFTIPTATPPELKGVSDRLLALSTSTPVQVEQGDLNEQPEASAQGVEAISSTAVPTERPTRTSAPTRITQAATREPTATAAGEAKKTTPSPTTEQKATAAIRPSSTPREDGQRAPTATLGIVEGISVVEQFEQKMNIGFKRIGELPHASDLSDYYDLNASQADENLKKIIAATLLGLPDDVRKSLSARIKNIVIARTLEGVSTVEDGGIEISFGESSMVGPERVADTLLFDAPDSSLFDPIPPDDEPRLKSGLAPDVEARLVLLSTAWTVHYVNADAQPSIAAFYADNTSVNYDHPLIEEFLKTLFFNEYSYALPLPDIVGRIIALKNIGEDERVAKAAAMGIVNIGRFPVIEE